MPRPLKNLQKMLEECYRQYKLGEITEKEYLEQIKPLDDAIDELELQALNCHLQGIPASEISSLQHLH